MSMVTIQNVSQLTMVLYSWHTLIEALETAIKYQYFDSFIIDIFNSYNRIYIVCVFFVKNISGKGFSVFIIHNYQFSSAISLHKEQQICIFCIPLQHKDICSVGHLFQNTNFDVYVRNKKGYFQVFVEHCLRFRSITRLSQRTTKKILPRLVCWRQTFAKALKTKMIKH